MEQMKFIKKRWIVLPLMALLLLGFSSGSMAVPTCDFSFIPSTGIYESGSDNLLLSTEVTVSDSVYLGALEHNLGNASQCRKGYDPAVFDLVSFYSQNNAYVTQLPSELIVGGPLLDQASGEVRFGRTAATGATPPDQGVSLTAGQPSYVLRYRFRVVDNLHAANFTSYVKFDSNTTVGGRCSANYWDGAAFVRIDPTTTPDHDAAFTIERALPPQKSQGAPDSEPWYGMDKRGGAGATITCEGTGGAKICGNTAVLNWGANADFNGHVWDRTLPIKYLVYRGTTNGTSEILSHLVFGPSALTSLQDGDNSGIITSGLSDESTYYYIVRAQDACVNPHIDQNGIIASVVPHDYVAPAQPSAQSGASSPSGLYKNGTAYGPFSGFVPGHHKVTLTWTNPTVADFKGVLVIGCDTSTWTGHVVSASGNINGTDYSTGETGGDLGNGKVLYKGPLTQFDVTAENNGTSLTNWTMYHYYVVAYDQAQGLDSEGMGQQGRNYSTALHITATPGRPPLPVSSFLGAKTQTDIGLNWINPNENWYGGVKILIKADSSITGPEDAAAYIALNRDYNLSKQGSSDSADITLYNGSPIDTFAHTYSIEAFCYDRDDTRPVYSTAAAPSYDSNPPGSVSFLYAMPNTSGSLKLHWFNPSDSDYKGVIVLRKPVTSEFATNSLPAHTPYTVGHIFNGNEVVVFMASAESYIDSGLTSGESYYYRAWAYDTSLNYSTIFDATGCIPGGGGGGGGGGFAGNTKIVTGWNLIATGQAATMLVNDANLIDLGTKGNQANADAIYQLIPGTRDFNKAYLSSVDNKWIDVLTNDSPTWEMDPDRGYFYKNRSATFEWGTRPKP